MKRGRPQAKDVPEALVTAAIEAICKRDGSACASLWGLQAALPQYPPRVVLARLRSMVRRGVIGAQCTCGCRGDFTIDPLHWYTTPEWARTA